MLVEAAEAPEGGEAAAETQPVLARVSGEASLGKGLLTINYVETEEREYVVPAAARILVENGDKVTAGQQLTDGSVNPQDILRIMGKEAVQQYLVDEVQQVYRSQGVNISDKHIEVIVRQMLTKVRIDSSGDTDLVPGELIDRFRYEEVNAKVLAEGGEPATAHTVLLGITRASLNTDSWLAAASFQETTRVLTEAALRGEIDRLVGLKENVIIGKLIPARYNLSLPEEPEETAEVPELVLVDSVLPVAEGETAELAEPDEEGELDVALPMSRLVVPDEEGSLDEDEIPED